MRESDARAIAGGTPGQELMGRAAKAIFEAAEWQPPVAVVCGKGNNGGDGYALACLLKEAEIGCSVLEQGEPTTAEALFYREKCKKAANHGFTLETGNRLWKIPDDRGLHLWDRVSRGSGQRSRSND
uniref:YjeF N-terminal region n=1 Tax=uncultured bacterium Contigcl_1149 TaxID=1393644 RepID=W0FLM2_9BACT|nr:yjeF N-terminal region [uncultured bacterium Contigcl_1149]